MILLLAGLTLLSQPEKGRLMPVTTSSKTALSYYIQAMKYFDEVKLKQGLETFKKALSQDKDFFMANYQLGFYYILNRDAENFNEYAEAAINCRANLSDVEEAFLPGR